MSIIEKIFGTDSNRELKKIYPIVDKVEALSDEYAAISDNSWFKKKTAELRSRLNDGETLDDLLPEAFAVVREAAKRVLDMYPYRVQLVAGVVLHQGRIAEMRTGEGKTLMAVLPAYLNALTGRGVHIVTVNDYLAKRDSEQMGKVFRFLGLSVGLITHDTPQEKRKEAYAADITYGTNNELGFDYLRDNMASSKQMQVQRGHAFAIVDEVDSILIDEARTPLIISGAGDASEEIYKTIDALVSGMEKLVIPEEDSKEETPEDLPYDYVVSEKDRTATLTARGVKKAEEYLGIENLADPENASMAHYINNAIRAHGCMKRDVNYVVTKNGEVIIVDENTGRLMPGRRFSKELHQAIEAKEGVEIQKESKTVASVSFQNYFRMYDKLSGMTGTAMTERDEFAEIYSLDVVEIPTNKTVIRVDMGDTIYKTEEAKLAAVIEEIKERHGQGQPVLIGTSSIRKNEELSKLLSDAGIAHNVLNAKNHEKEAMIVAQAGRLGAVTLATNMAGRGTDIILGGNPEHMAMSDLYADGFPEEVVAEAVGHNDDVSQEVLEARYLYAEKLCGYQNKAMREAAEVRAVGGLAVIGTERHDSRRVDNQLRGRAGRQGDPGCSHFYVSLEDDLMRLFGGERIQVMLDNMNVPDDLPVEMRSVASAIQNAQITVESRNYQARKSVIEYDDVMNKQRTVVYEQRQKVLDGEDMKETIQNMMHRAVEESVSEYLETADKSEDKVSRVMSIVKKVGQDLLPNGVEFRFSKQEAENASDQDLIDLFNRAADDIFAAQEKQIGSQNMRWLERAMLLNTVDSYWVDQLDAMSDLKQDVSLRGYAQVNPVDIYKKEGAEMFEEMNRGIRRDTTKKILSFAVVPQE